MFLKCLAQWVAHCKYRINTVVGSLSLTQHWDKGIKFEMILSGVHWDLLALAQQGMPNGGGKSERL